ncbi:MAG: phosphodiester glycosidase family protein [Firmicutes bacterium]|nr:phosphodiester glycosidase family protein [Bacillota bacterium]
MSPSKKRRLATCTLGVLAVLYSIYVLLDTFLLTRIQQEAQADNLSVFQNLSVQEITEKSEAPDTSVTSQENSQEFAEDDVNYDYADENIRILLREYRQYDTSIYVAEVWLSSAEYLKTALAEGSYGKNITQKTSEMASENQAILAINGDYYGARQTGYVIRNGVIYREEGAADTDVLCIYADGSLAITNSSEKSAEELVREGVWQAFSFGPGLLEDGQITVSETDEVGKAKASNPRTAIGIIDDLHYVFVVSDGRTDASEGLSLYQLAEFLQSLGVQTAYNLDGGGSSTMVLNGEIINNPTTGGNHTKERSVSDIVYITAG